MSAVLPVLSLLTKLPFNPLDGPDHLLPFLAGNLCLVLLRPHDTRAAQGEVVPPM